jgi:parallel beta-helix repeat protein
MKHRLGIACLGLLLVGRMAQATVFTVTTTADSGAGSLRQALINANTAPGPDVVEFNLPGPGVQTIALLTALPEITNSVAINGYSQPGSSTNSNSFGRMDAVLLVRLDGRGISNGLPAALRFNAASGSSVRGLVMVRFAFGIEIYDSSNVTVAGNSIGLDVDGIARGMIFDGVSVSCPVFSQALNNRIGGTSPADRNVISGNGTGISFSGTTAANNFVLGNLIGTDFAGRLPRGNVFAGIDIFSATNITIGDGSLGGRNLLSACTGAGGAGVSILSGGGHLIQGNLIGTDITGFLDLGNSSDGIFAQGANNVRIIGNEIVNNRANGIQLLSSSGSVIERNWIGTDGSSPTVFPLGNALAGVLISGSTNRVGSLTPYYGNIIQYNGGAGVAVTSGERNEITGNEIYDNGGLGIDLGWSGGTANDIGDPDPGANQLQNFPFLAAATNIYGSLRVTGSLDTSPNAGFRLEFFASPAFDPEGLAEGQLLLGTYAANTDANGAASFALTLSNAPPADYLITATATDARGNTSEFSPGIPIVAGPASVSLSLQPTAADTLTLSWPAAASVYQLESTSTLSPTSQWQTVTAGITTVGDWKQLVVTNAPATGNGFFRLKKP